MMKLLPLVAAVALVFACKRAPVTVPTDILVYSANTKMPLPSMDVAINGVPSGETPEDGVVYFSGSFSSDIITPTEPHWNYEGTYRHEYESRIEQHYAATKIPSTNDSAGTAFLLSLQNSTGLLPSVEGGSLVSTYDQALAAIAFVVTGHHAAAANIFDYFAARVSSELQAAPGGFHQFRSPQGTPLGRRWMGDNAWLLIALNNYVHATHDHQYDALSDALEHWLYTLVDTADGGLWGGYDEQGNRIHKVTEGNIDAFAALFIDQEVRRGIAAHLRAEKYDSIEGNFMAWPTNPTYAYALDCYTWGHNAFPQFNPSARSYVSKFALQTTSAATGQTLHGYCFDEDLDVLWLEGTAQVAGMYWVGCDQQLAEQILAEMDLAWATTPSGQRGLPYSANTGTSYGADPLWTTAHTHPCISSTAWYLMASYRHNPLWHSRGMLLPEEEMYWK